MRKMSNFVECCQTTASLRPSNWQVARIHGCCPSTACHLPIRRTCMAVEPSHPQFVSPLSARPAGSPLVSPSCYWLFTVRLAGRQPCSSYSPPAICCARSSACPTAGLLPVQLAVLGCRSISLPIRLYTNLAAAASRRRATFTPTRRRSFLVELGAPSA